MVTRGLTFGVTIAMLTVCHPLEKFLSDSVENSKKNINEMDTPILVHTQGNKSRAVFADNAAR